MTDLFWEDSTNAFGLQSGMFGYAGYFNGPFANLSSIRARFPGKPVMGYATRVSGALGADAIDCEPGTLGGDFTSNAAGAVAFVKAWTGGSGIFNKPVVYCMASWLSSMETYLAAHDVPRSSYYLNSAHPNGLHFCGPNSCGYGHSASDMTQFEFAGGFDKTVMRSYVLKTYGPSPTPAPTQVPVPGLPATLKSGDTGKAVVLLRVHLDAWGAHLPANADGAHDAFGPLVLAAVENFQKSQKLLPDGVVGPLTWAAVLSRPPVAVHPVPVPPVPVLPKHPVLHQGDKGAEVKLLQIDLNRHGVNPKLTVDGDFGALTARDVRWFQGRHGLPESTIVDGKTWAYLDA
jgi:peptidoglycan hydrolase-like protein with peptidoglycan-binding domain